MHISFNALLVAGATINMAQAHTLFTNFFVNGTPQGDGTCVRMPTTIPNATDPLPVSSMTTSDIACGIDGQNGVARVCPVAAGSTITAEFRTWPDASQPGSIDISHKGPCTVYMKKVDDATADNNAAGPGCVSTSLTIRRELYRRMWVPEWEFDLCKRHVLFCSWILWNKHRLLWQWMSIPVRHLLHQFEDEAWASTTAHEDIRAARVAKSWLCTVVKAYGPGSTPTVLHSSFLDRMGSQCRNSFLAAGM